MEAFRKQLNKLKKKKKPSQRLKADSFFAQIGLKQKTESQPYEPTPFACDLCGERFKDPPHLATHLFRTHQFHNTSCVNIHNPSARDGYVLAPELSIMFHQPLIKPHLRCQQKCNIKSHLELHKREFRIRGEIIVLFQINAHGHWIPQKTLKE